MALNVTDYGPNTLTWTNNNTVAEYTATTAFSGSGSSADFTATSDNYLTAPDNTSALKVTGNFTIEFWVKTKSALTGGILVELAFSDTTGQGGVFTSINGSGGVRFLSGRATNNTQGDGWQHANSATAINDTNWHHVACTWDGTDLKIYIDGNSTADASVSWGNAPAYNATSYHVIGTFNGSGSFGHGGNDLDGYLDEIRVWSVAKTGAEIAAAYNAQLTGTEANLVTYLPFNLPASAGGAFFALVQ